jgi:putative ABC transport system substrate-binding protein
MRRREFLTLVGGAAVACPLAARAQRPAMPVIGYLLQGSTASNENIIAAFRKGLSETGYVEGRNIAIEYRSANHDATRQPELLADLIRRRVAVIVTPGGLAAALAAKAATAIVPIVFSIGADPVAAGLVASLNRPGGNVTGFTSLNVEITAKRLGLLHELLPGAARLAVLINPTSPVADSVVSDAQAAAATIGRRIEVLAAATNPEIDMAFASLAQKRIEALLVHNDPLFFDRRVQLATLAARHAVPAIYPFRENAEAGGLMSYGTNLADRERQVGIYVGRILKGEKPADLPVIQAAKFEFIINLQTARALGIEIPSTLLATADEVIE